MRVPIKPDLIRWARERAGLEQAALAARFGKLPEWEAGEAQPTLRQVEAFARAVNVPTGHLFLYEPPEESVPIPDFRTLDGQAVTRPSPNLLDTIHSCQERQSWYREFVRISRQPELGFIGSVGVETLPETAAARMCDTPRLQPCRPSRVRDVDRGLAPRRPPGRERRHSCHGQRYRGEQQFPASRPRRISRVRSVRFPRAAGLCQRCGYEGGADVHARPRACASVARRLRAHEHRGCAPARFPARGGLVQRRGGRTSGPARRVARRTARRRSASRRAVPTREDLQGQHPCRPAAPA